MAYAFVRRADGLLMCRLDAEEKAVIAQVAQETAELIRTDLGLRPEPRAVRRAAASEDPLDRLEAEFAAQDARDPRDPAVQRLFPAASPDPHLAREMRRYGQADLVESKLAALDRIPAVIDASGPLRTEIVLDGRDATAWLTALTDLRVVLAERLGLRDDADEQTLRVLQEISSGVSEEAPAPPADDAEQEEAPSTASPDLVLAVYDLLTWLQESLVGVVASDIDGS